MSNLFEEVLKDAQGVQERLLGPTYPYQNILNRRFPTVAHTPEITSAQREKYIGNFFTKDNP